jgi:hypothetical protein
MDLRVASLVLVILLAGCSSKGNVAGGGANPSTTPVHYPAPSTLVSKEVNACDPTKSDKPVQVPPVGQPITNVKFEVKEGFDQLIIAFHVSGEGRVSAKILNEENTAVWQKPEATYDTTASGVPCGAHQHSGDGDVKSIEPGNFTYSIGYTGAIAIHLEVTARSSHASMANMTMEHHHGNMTTG